jgi:hypothetical protein
MDKLRTTILGLATLAILWWAQAQEHENELSHVLGQKSETHITHTSNKPNHHDSHWFAVQANEYNKNHGLTAGIGGWYKHGVRWWELCWLGNTEHAWLELDVSETIELWENNELQFLEGVSALMPWKKWEANPHEEVYSKILYPNIQMRLIHSFPQLGWSIFVGWKLENEWFIKFDMRPSVEVGVEIPFNFSKKWK